MNKKVAKKTAKKVTPKKVVKKSAPKKNKFTELQQFKKKEGEAIVKQLDALCEKYKGGLYPNFHRWKKLQYRYRYL
jgi:hypothetical protein